MFDTDEYVVYGNKGVCLVTDITQMDMPGSPKGRLYYVLEPIQNQASKVYLPVDNDKVVIRSIMTSDEAAALLKSIPEVEQLVVADEKKREVCYKEALRSCSGRLWISMLKTLYVRRKERISMGKKITALDEKYLRATEHELIDELSLSLGITQEEAEGYLQEHLEQV